MNPGSRPKSNRPKVNIPAPLTLRDIIYNQLQALGWNCTVDAFSDKSASWIDVQKELPGKRKEGTVKSVSIQFDWEGNKIQDLQLWETEIVLTELESIKIF